VALSLLAGALAGWSTSISAAAIALAIGAASAVGLACGAYPARVAAALTPCDALRGD
jgi:ABC-type antimicrobial peptide transport system permease subunit